MMTTFSDISKACGHYILMTSVMEASCERLDKYLTVEASKQLFEMLRHRKKIVAMLDKIKETDYV
jgi:hypothetical protein